MANTGQFAKVIVTAAGKDMIAKSQGGKILHFTRVSLGDGLVAPGEDPVNYTSVKNERLSVPIAKYNNLNNGQFEIQFRVSNQNVTEGFWHREIGIMAKIDNGTEELYAYTTAGNTASYIYDKTAPVDERVVNVTFVIGNALNLNVVIDNSVVYLTKKDYEQSMREHENNPEAHGNAMQTHNEDESAHADMVGATENLNGKRGMVPAPKINDRLRFLRGDGEWIDVSDTTPVGDVVYRPYLRTGYVKANGATVNRSDYPRLVAFADANNLWTSNPSTEPWKYGRGNGNTTMVLPDYRNRFIQGGDSSSVKSAGLPNITYKLTPEETGASQTGVFTQSAFNKGSLFENGAMKMQKTRDAVTSGSGWFEVASLDFDASRCSLIYGSANTVQPPSIQLIPQLRY